MTHTLRESPAPRERGAVKAWAVLGVNAGARRGVYGMIDKDLMPFMGTSGRVSEVVSGRRALTIGMIRKLHRGLGIPADALIAEYDMA